MSQQLAGGTYAHPLLHRRQDATVFQATAERLLTGTAPAGWSHAADLAEQSGLEFGISELFANGLLILVLVAVLIIAARSAGLLVSTSMRVGQETKAWRRSAVSLGLLGVISALLPALLAGLSNMHQTWARFPIGKAWRETVLTQIGWSFMATAVLVAAFGVARTRWASHATAVAVATGLLICVSLTLLANARLNRADRETPLHVVSNEIATATIHFDPTPEGNARRCSLIDDYTLFHGEPDKWLSGPNIHRELDALMIKRRGMPFCDTAQEP